jgi:acetyl-CoA carboxylase carboxyltransferase component
MSPETLRKKVEELTRRKRNIYRGGGEDKVRKQHAIGKLTARERIDRLLDKGTFREFDQFVHHRCHFFGMERVKAPGDGVVAGHGKIDGRDVFLFSQDFTVLGGTLGEAHASKIVKIMDLAAKVGAPVIGINDSGGGRIQEGFDAQYGYARIFYRNAIYSGVIPQISVILGPCAGGAVYSPALTDFIFMTEDISYMFLTGPKVTKEVTGEDISMTGLGGPLVHCDTSGVAHFYTKSEEECLERVRKLLSFIPSSSREKPPIEACSDPVDRRNKKLLEVVPTDSRKSYDVVKVISEITDHHEFFEVHERWAKNIVVGFARINGISIGIVANQPRVLAGAIDIDASDKAARFVRCCDAFNVPLLTLVDTPAFLPGKNQEFGGIIRHGAKLIFAYSEATVPKITVILRKAYGGGYIAMCHPELKADRVFAWPTAEIAMMGAEGAAEIIFRREIEGAQDPSLVRKEKIEKFREQFGTPYSAASRGYIDEIIDPRETRMAIAHSLELLMNKQESRPNRKHGNIPL